MRCLELLSVLLLCAGLQGCLVATAVGAVTDVAVEVVKVPFKVGGAVVDAVSSDEPEAKKPDEPAPPKSN